jgi:hypothetical protein
MDDLQKDSKMTDHLLDIETEKEEAERKHEDEMMTLGHQADAIAAFKERHPHEEYDIRSYNIHGGSRSIHLLDKGPQVDTQVTQDYRQDQPPPAQPSPPLQRIWQITQIDEMAEGSPVHEAAALSGEFSAATRILNTFSDAFGQPAADLISFHCMETVFNILMFLGPDLKTERIPIQDPDPYQSPTDMLVTYRWLTTQTLWKKLMVTLLDRQDLPRWPTPLDVLYG